jgi:methionyl-tRNA formyltransferase
VTDGRAGGSRVRTVFLGSGQFGAESLRSLARHPDVDLVGVVTAPPRPSGRSQRLAPTYIASTARELGIGTVLTPERLRAPGAIASVLALRPDLAALADYGQLVPPALLGLRHGALNLHPSLLPRHRGATPIPAAIIAQQRVGLGGTETAPELEAQLRLVADALLNANLGPWLRGEIQARPQPTEGATLTRPLRREDGRLDPARPAYELERQVRAYQPWPGSFLDTGLGRLIVLEAEAEAADGLRTAGGSPGTLVPAARGLALATADGRLRLDRAQLAGRRATDGASLLRGAPGLIGQTVELR